MTIGELKKLLEEYPDDLYIEVDVFKNYGMYSDPSFLDVSADIVRVDHVDSHINGGYISLGCT